MKQYDTVSLDEYVKDYAIIIDTCSILSDYAEAFFNNAYPLLMKYKKKIIVPYKCLREVNKHAASNNAQLAISAARANDLLMKCNNRGMIEIKGSSWESEDTFADNTILTIFNMHRKKYNMLLITQDNALAKEIIELNDSKAVLGKRVDAKRIVERGNLGSYSWQLNSNISMPHSHISQTKQTNLPSNECFKLCTKLTTISSNVIHLKSLPGEGSTVYTNSGKSVVLGKSIDEGGEGIIYNTNTGSVAKIYLDGKLTAIKREKIKRLTEKKIKCEGICFPESELYNSNKEFVGYLMPAASGKKLQTSIFLKPLLIKYFPKWNRKDLVTLAITILKKIIYLHDRNIIIGDINAANILVESPTKVFFVDVDSYQIEDLPCPVGVPSFTAPEIQGKQYATFLRSFGNEYFSIATLMFMLMLAGKSPYAQQGGEDPGNNIRKMDFPYPIKDIKGDKIPRGTWAFIWSHLPYKLKEAFYESFKKGSAHSSENNRLSPKDWLAVFEQYYYELTDGNMIKNDPMSLEIFPSRSKKDPNVTYIKCKICGQEQDERYCKNGYCNSCLNLPAGKCSDCGKDLSFTNYSRFIKNQPVPLYCQSCNEKRKKASVFCQSCGVQITKGERINGYCPSCWKKIQNKKKESEKVRCCRCQKLFDKKLLVNGYCPSCLSTIQKERRNEEIVSCPNCGKALKRKNLKNGYCPSCWKKIEKGNRLVKCPGCGISIRKKKLTNGLCPNCWNKKQNKKKESEKVRCCRCQKLLDKKLLVNGYCPSCLSTIQKERRNEEIVSCPNCGKALKRKNLKNGYCPSCWKKKQNAAIKKQHNYTNNYQGNTYQQTNREAVNSVLRKMGFSETDINNYHMNQNSNPKSSNESKLEKKKRSAANKVAGWRDEVLDELLNPFKKMKAKRSFDSIIKRIHNASSFDDIDELLDDADYLYNDVDY